MSYDRMDKTLAQLETEVEQLLEDSQVSVFTHVTQETNDKQQVKGV